jgi:hypothetical protein
MSGPALNVKKTALVFRQSPFHTRSSSSSSATEGNMYLATPRM